MIGEAIRHLRNHYVEIEELPDIRSINNGLCVTFAEEIEYMVDGAEHTSNDFFVVNMDEGWNGNGCDKWDVKLLLEANSLPPAPYTMETANQIQGYHRWIQFNGKHYDAECPDGVVNFFELPFFKRWLEAIHEEDKKTQRH